MIILNKRVMTVGYIIVLFMLFLLPSSTISVAAASTQMPSMHEIDSANVKTVEEVTDSYGKTYSSNIFAFDCRLKGYVRYELNGKYQSFSGDLIAANSTGSSANMMFSIFADGKEVYTISGFTKQKDAQSIEISLVGVNVIEFMSRDLNNSYDSWLYITNGVFTQADKASLTYPEWASLNDVVLVDSGNYESYNTLSMDSYGELYCDGYGFDARNGGYALYNLNREYEVFSGYIFPQRNASDSANISITIYTDDTPVYSQTGIKNTTEAIPFEINVANAKTLKVETSVEKSGYDQTVYIGSTKLSKHQHVEGEATIDKEATCTEDGTKSIYCTECGNVISSETIHATGHTPDGKWIIKTPATCTDEGEQIQNCKVCKKEAESEVIPATGHTGTGEWEVLKEASCTEEGEEVEYCSVCGEVSDIQVLPLIEHQSSGEWVVTKEATCNSEGEQVQYCLNCTYVADSEVIPKTEHDFGRWETISGSIWNTPVVKERECSICGEIETSSSNATSWLKPLIIVLLLIIVAGATVLGITLKMNGLALNPSNIKKLFSKSAITDEDVEKILNKPSNDGDSSDSR